jgi:hypothetical protein
MLSIRLLSLVIGSDVKKGFTIFLIPEESGLPSVQFRVSFVSIVTGIMFVFIICSVFFLGVFDLNIAADDGQMHSENLRIRSELDAMHVETRELQRQIELLQAYSLHIDISTEEVGSIFTNETKKTKKKKPKNKKIKKKKEQIQEQKKPSNPEIFIEVKEGGVSPPDSEKNKSSQEIFIDVRSEENPSKKK